MIIFALSILLNCYLLFILFKRKNKFPALFYLNVQIDERFSKIEKLLIIKALIQWEDALSGLVCFKIKQLDGKKLLYNTNKADALNFIKEVSTNSKLMKLEQKTPNLKGCCGCCIISKNMRLIFLVRDRIRGYKIFSQTVLHETGHALGLDHNPLTNTIMYYFVGRNMSYHPTKYDTNALIYKIRNQLAISNCDQNGNSTNNT